jgi:hypothetical protein
MSGKIEIGNSPCESDGFSVVQGFELGELIGMALNQVCEFVQKTATFDTGGVPSPRSLKRLARCRDSGIDILCGCLKTMIV